MPAFTWDIDPVLVTLGPLAIRYYSLLYVGVFLGGYRLLDWQIQRAGGDEEDGSDFVLYGVIAVLGGARVGHVLFYDFDKFIEDPLWLFMIWRGGLASHGATIGLLIAMYVFCKRRNQSFIEGTDRFAFSAALGSILVRIGNFFNSEIVGRATGADWGVRFPRYDRAAVQLGMEAPLRHPSQLYEVALGCAVMAALLIADKLAGKEKRPRGLMISLFFALYFTGRFFVEYVKEFQTLAHDAPLTMGQMLSIPAALVGYLGIIVSLNEKVPARWNVPETANEDHDDDDYDDEDEDGDEDVDDVLLDRG